MLRNVANQIVPVYLEDASGNPVTGASPSAGQLRISQSGDGIIDGEGAWQEAGSGYYRYRPTQDESNTESYLAVLVTIPGTAQYPVAAFIDGSLSPTGASRARRIPVWMADASGTGVTGLSLAGTATQIAVGAAGFANALGNRGESGAGLYYYENTSTDLTTTVSVLKVLGAGAKPYVYSFTPNIAREPAALAAPPVPPFALGESSQGTLMIVAPTAPNVVLMVAENISANLLKGQSSNLALPSLYKRAYLVAYETDEIAVVKR